MPDQAIEAIPRPASFARRGRPRRHRPEVQVIEADLVDETGSPSSRRRRRSDGGGRLGLVAVLLPFAAGYFLSYWVGTINGPLSDGLSGAFGLGPAELGLLTSLYFLAFAAFQIPAGLLIDRYGPRRVQSAMLVVATAGGFLFAGAQGWPMLMLGRALIGLGCSSALMTGVKMLALSLPPERRATGNCLLVMCGGLGAMASAVPVGVASGPGDWRALFACFGVLSLLVSAWLFLAVPEGARKAAPAGAPASARG